MSHNDGDVFPPLLLRILDSIETHVAMLDLNGRILLANKAWRRFGATRGARPDAYVGVSYLEVCERSAANGDEDAESVRRGLVSVLNCERRSFSHHYQCEDQVFQLRATRIDYGGVSWVLMTHDDVTAVVRARDELSVLADQLLGVQEDERARIARELHDSTSQHLVALQFGLAAVRQGRATEETLNDMRRELEEAHKEIRTLSYLLHPPSLQREGLTRTLNAFIDGCRERSGISITLAARGEIDGLPFTIQQSLFRVVQEAISNAHRHGQAQRISVEISLTRKGVLLLVVDDGRAGGDPQRPSGLGVRGMNARFQSLGGMFSIDFTPGGTRVRAFIPANRIEVTAAEAAAAEPPDTDAPQSRVRSARTVSDADFGGHHL